MSETEESTQAFQYDGDIYPTLARALRAAYWDFLNATPQGFDFEGTDEEMAAFDVSFPDIDSEAYDDALSEALQGAIFVDGIALTDANIVDLVRIDASLHALCIEAMATPPVYVFRGEDYDFLETALLAAFLEWNGGELADAETLEASPLLDDLAHWLQLVVRVDGIKLDDWNVEHLTPYSDTLLDVLFSSLRTLAEDD